MLLPSFAPASVPADCVAVQGVGARPFDPGLWQQGSLNLVPNARGPLLTPLPGAYRNIYAPSVVQMSNRWRIFYGGWDGTSSGNDHVYSVTTPDFQNFYNRGELISPGTYQHVCNVNALRLTNGELSALCTVYPDSQGYNGIANFQGLSRPVTVSAHNMIHIAGYPDHSPNFNGMNAQLFDDGMYHLYFGDIRKLTHVYHAVSQDGVNYTYLGAALESSHCVNDVKKFWTPNGPVYLMALHDNCSHTWYSLSSDGVTFGPEQPLIASESSAEKYIVSLGWVTRGGQENPGRRMLGLIYGAGSSSRLDANRIFVRWLQLKLVFVNDDGQTFPGTVAANPSTQIIPLKDAQTFSGIVQVYAEDGRTLLCETPHVQLSPGMSYQLRLFNLPQTFSALN